MRGGRGEGILVEGRNCWKIAESSRAAFLIDGSAYYAALAAAVRRARESILVVGWDIDSRISLVRDTGKDHGNQTLVGVLNEAVDKTRGLQVHILAWDFAMIYALEREFLPVFTFNWKARSRVHFELDGKHPIGASHHQKIVVVDDTVAFAGGLDLTRSRWDTPEHRVNDPRRTEPGNGSYPPFHDVQMMVEGEIALRLGELARARWRRSAGSEIKAPRVGASDPWPPWLTPDIENVLIGVSRTEPEYDGRPETREVEALYRDAISAARRFIYIENQYLTSSLMGELLAKRLEEREGPETVIVLPKKSSGWLEVKTMDALRVRLIRRLREADRFDRLRVYYPVLSKGSAAHLNVHSKVLVVDDDLVRVGSSNLSNRSMGLDTECDLVLEAKGEARIREAIAGFRNRLLGEHLGVAPEVVRRTFQEKGSLAGMIDALDDSERTLTILDVESPGGDEAWLAPAELADPERPRDPAELIDQFVPVETDGIRKRRLAGGLGVLVLLLGFAAAWQWTPLHNWLDLGTLVERGRFLTETPLAVVIVTAIYMAGGVVVFPVTLLVVATAIIFPPLTAFLYSLLGCILSAAVVFGMGHLVGRETVRRLLGRRVNQLSLRLAQRGLLTVITLRLFPVAPYSVVNFVAGASHIKFSDFVVGTIIGLIPGILAITIFGESLEETIRNPSMGNVATLGFLVVLFLMMNVAVRKWLDRKKPAPAPDATGENITA